MDKNQSLFSHLKQNYVMPFVFVKRDSIMTQDQVKNILGDLISANKVKTPLLVTFIALAVLMVICSAFLCRKHGKTNDSEYGEKLYSPLGNSRMTNDSVRKINQSIMKSTST